MKFAALLWSAIHKMKLICNSTLVNSLKIRTFKATIEPILLYGSECWTMTQQCVSKSMVVIPGYLEWLLEDHHYTVCNTHTCIGEHT